MASTTKEQLVNRAMELVEESETTLSNPGICHACGHEQDGCEPDAREYECEECRKKKVYGAQETLIMLGGI